VRRAAQYLLCSTLCLAAASSVALATDGTVEPVLLAQKLDRGPIDIDRTGGPSVRPPNDPDRGGGSGAASPSSPDLDGGRPNTSADESSAQRERAAEAEQRQRAAEAEERSRRQRKATGTAVTF
jgi:hypothetical protein